MSEKKVDECELGLIMMDEEGKEKLREAIIGRQE